MLYIVRRFLGMNTVTDRSAETTQIHDCDVALASWHDLFWYREGPVAARYALSWANCGETRESAAAFHATLSHRPASCRNSFRLPPAWNSFRSLYLVSVWFVLQPAISKSCCRIYHSVDNFSCNYAILSNEFCLSRCLCFSFTQPL